MVQARVGAPDESGGPLANPGAERDAMANIEKDCQST
jgi:hypothetical protein